MTTNSRFPRLPEIWSCFASSGRIVRLVLVTTRRKAPIKTGNYKQESPSSAFYNTAAKTTDWRSTANNVIRENSTISEPTNLRFKWQWHMAQYSRKHLWRYRETDLFGNQFTASHTVGLTTEPGNSWESWKGIKQIQIAKRPCHWRPNKIRLFIIDKKKQTSDETNKYAMVACSYFQQFLCAKMILTQLMRSTRIDIKGIHCWWLGAIQTHWHDLHSHEYEYSIVPNQSIPTSDK